MPEEYETEADLSSYTMLTAGLGTYEGFRPNLNGVI
jgi:hypothetical protein